MELVRREQSGEELRQCCCEPDKKTIESVQKYSNHMELEVIFLSPLKKVTII